MNKVQYLYLSCVVNDILILIITFNFVNKDSLIFYIMVTIIIVELIQLILFDFIEVFPNVIHSKHDNS